jgi:integrase
MKGKRDHAVPLTPVVLALMGTPPKNMKAHPFVFSTTGGVRPFSGFGKAKSALDRHIAEIRKNGRDPMPGGVIDDLRRTAKTLMIRAGVRPCSHLSGSTAPKVEDPEFRDAGPQSIYARAGDAYLLIIRPDTVAARTPRIKSASCP